MTESEAAHMVVEVHAAWPEALLTYDDERQLRNLFAPYSESVVRQVIADCIEAEQPCPTRKALNTMLRMTEPAAVKTDPQPKPTGVRRQAPGPFVSDIPESAITPPSTELMAAVKAGDIAEIRRLLGQPERLQ